MTTIKLKNGSGAPTSGDLVTAEPALDLTNKRLYTEDSGGTVIEVGTNPGTDVTFADNRKAIFGAGSDLQIYHDGSNSYIDEVGTGDLYIRGGDDIRIQVSDGVGGWNNALRARETGATNLFYAASTKLSTTSTGIDVTGTVTADAFEVDDTDDIRLRFLNASTFKAGLQVATTAGDMIGGSAVDDLAIRSQTNMLFATGGNTQRMRISSGGDISFYEDTGTTAKLFWDASAESLGIGTSSPNATLKVQGPVDTATISTSSTPAARINNGGAISNWIGANGYNYGYIQSIQDDGTNNLKPLALQPLGGNVGIGTSSVSAQLHLQDGSTEDVSGSTIRMDLSGINPYWEVQARNGGSAANRQLGFYTSATSGDVLTLTQAGNVGIGDDNPLSILHIGGGSDANVPVTFAPSTGGNAEFRNTSSTGTFTFTKNNGSSEAVRIDASGNLLVGTTDTAPGVADTNVGVALNSGRVFASAEADYALNLNRNTTDGDIARFRKDGSTVGSIRAFDGVLQISGGSVSGLQFSSQVRPMANGSTTDASTDLGRSANRWRNIYASNGTIQTSDRNEKQDIEALSDAEQRVAVACKGLLRKFRWIKSVEEKGDDARIHFGIIAQDLQDAFTAEGLDAGRYAMFINSTWTDEETGEERSRMGVRYSELLAFIISAI